MDKPDWNQKQAVSIRIVAQLKDMTEEERKAFILKLLDHLDPMFVQALDFAYGGIPEEEKKERNGTIRTHGKSSRASC